MKEILRSDNVFELKLIQQFLSDYDIHAVIMDEHSGTLMSGIGNILPRMMVLDDDFDAALALIEEHKDQD
ncbi:MAG: DUF2007 domain-containing protein [Alphaproteobacteria bacterium]|nr:DUF2007 domain-containing protein [Alphaproteobacteria bacterium]